MKNIFLIVGIIAIFSACSEDVYFEPSANFSTNIVESTLQAGKGFTIYLDNVDGEFSAYYKGSDSTNTYNPNLGLAVGKPIDAELDSLPIVGYNSPGTYTFTLWSGTYYNNGEDVEEDVKSIQIEVISAE